MFWKRKKVPDSLFLVFLAITLGLIISLSFVLLRFFSQSRLSADTGQADGGAVNLYDALVADPGDQGDTAEQGTRAVEITYRDDVASLKRSVESYTGTDDALLKDAEHKLLSMRVPKDFLDPHLQAVLDLRRITINEERAEQIRVRVGEIVETLLQALEG